MFLSGMLVGNYWICGWVIGLDGIDDGEVFF